MWKCKSPHKYVGPGTIILKKVEEYIQRISDDPDILLSPTASYATGTLDGLKWERPGTVAAIFTMKENLPHLSAVISAFLFRCTRNMEVFYN